MHFPIWRVAVCGLVLLSAAFGQGAAPAGHYEGTLQMPNGDQGFSIDIDRNAAKAWIGHLSMARGAKNLPLGKITVGEDGSVRFELTGLPGSPVMEGKWDKEAKTIKGNASSDTGSVPFEVKWTSEAKVVLPKENGPIGKELEGRWEGSLETPNGTLRIQVNLKSQDGKGSGTLVSVDQGGQSFPLSGITQAGNAFEFDLPLVGGHYKGTLNAEKTEMKGDWTQGERTLPLALKKAAETK